MGSSADVGRSTGVGVLLACVEGGDDPRSMTRGPRKCSGVSRSSAGSASEGAGGEVSMHRMNSRSKSGGMFRLNSGTSTLSIVKMR